MEALAETDNGSREIAAVPNEIGAEPGETGLRRSEDQHGA